MGKTPVSLKIDGERLRHVLKDHDMNFSERAQKYGVTRQALNGWLSTGRIPPRALAEIILEVKMAPEELDLIIISSKEEKPPKTGGMYGWICPQCKRGNSPMNPACSCTDDTESDLR